MNCRCASSRISAYLDGELPGSESLALREHLRSCSACTDEMEALRRLKIRLSALGTLPPPADLPTRLTARLTLVDEPAPAVAPWAGRIALAAVAAAAMALAVVAHRTMQPTDPTLVKRSSTFDVNNDQAFVAGGDPLSGQPPVLTVGR